LTTSRFPKRGEPLLLKEIDFGHLLLDLIVAVGVLTSTSYCTRQWLALSFRPFQFSLLGVLLLPVVLLVSTNLAGLESGVMLDLLAVFLAFGVACTGYSVVYLAVRCALWIVRARSGARN